MRVTLPVYIIFLDCITLIIFVKRHVIKLLSIQFFQPPASSSILVITILNYLNL